MSDLAICTKSLARQGMPLWHLDSVFDTQGGVHDTSTPTHAGGSSAAQLLRAHDPSLNPHRSVRTFLLYLLNERKLSWGTIQGARSALKFFYTRTLKQTQFDRTSSSPRIDEHQPVPYLTKKAIDRCLIDNSRSRE
jgi:hypothetical protein